MYASASRNEADLCMRCAQKQHRLGLVLTVRRSWELIEAKRLTAVRIVRSRSEALLPVFPRRLCNAIHADAMEKVVDMHQQWEEGEECDQYKYDSTQVRRRSRSRSRSRIDASS